MQPAWVENEPISLLNAARVAYGRDKCHDEQDLLYPSWVTLRECVLPTKIHFRYCWLFSGACERSTTRRVAADESLTDQEDAVRFNRHLMSDTPVIGYAEKNYAINAFWLLTDGRVVFVDEASEDHKLRNIRAKNLRNARKLWRADSNSCSHIIRAAGAAYEKFLRLCGEAAYSNGGNACFYNTYATYPLATDHHDEETDLHETTYADELEERDVLCRDINTAHALLTLLDPLYQAYFDLMIRGGDAVLKETVRCLGAEWLVEQERTELRIASEIAHHWFIRFLVRLTMLFSMY